MLTLKRTVDSDFDFAWRSQSSESLLLDLLELIHCVVSEFLFLPNRFLKKGRCFDITQCNCC